ncbi:MAG: sodium:solute symporter family protein [Peptococcaceae bacterium]|nr:sodium:solute symporter family protein [Peptococcaceae bacterium]
MSRELVFLIFFILFAGILTWGGWITRRWISDSSDFIIAGREVSLLINVFGVAAIGFAGTSIALGPGLAVSFGFWGSMSWAAIYSLGGLALYGLLFTTFIRRCGAQTLPEWLEMRYGPDVRLIVTVTTVLGLIGILANNVVSMASVITGYVGWPLFVSISLCFLIFMAFSYFSGLWAVTLTDFIQMIIGLVAIPLFIFTLIGMYGGGEWLAKNWPGPDYWTAGIKGASVPILTLKYPSVLTFVLLFAFFLVYGNNYYWLRAASCRSERSARLSYVYAGILLVFVIYIPLAFIGLYAGAAHPTTFAPAGKMPSTAAYGLLLKALPAALSSFLLIGALAASISTAATAHIGATATATRDIYQRVIKPGADPGQLLTASRVILLLLGFLTWFLCFYPGGPVYLFAFANAWLGPPSVLILLGILWPRCTRAGALWGTVLGMATMALFTLLELAKVYVISNVMHVGVAGLIATLLPAVLISLITKPKYYGDPGFKGQEEVKLNETDLMVLDLIRYGHRYMSEITDALKTDSRISNESVEKLDRGGYIKRLGSWGSAFYTFEITPLGESVLPAVDEGQREMIRDGLKPEYLDVLKAAGQGTEKITRLSGEKGWTSLELSSVISHLVNLGYLKEAGLWRRILLLTDKGRQVMQKYSALA